MNNFTRAPKMRSKSNKDLRQKISKQRLRPVWIPAHLQSEIKSWLFNFLYIMSLCFIIPVSDIYFNRYIYLNSILLGSRP